MKSFYRNFGAICAVFLFSLLLVKQHSTAMPSKEPEETFVTLSVRSSPKADLESKLELYSPEINQALKKAVAQKAYIPFSLKDVYVTIRQAGHESCLRMERSGSLWNEAERERLILPKEAGNKLLSYAEALRKHHYGKIIPWKDAQYLVPRKSVFFVTDLETGLTFHVQRRAGSDHADVQPLTKEDTKIMKQMYNNHWSWMRKSILVHTGNKWIAASMNGMPHGGDGIPGNGFSGHFCIHFYGSTTHKSVHPDSGHQLMVHKAGGMLRPYLDDASPDVLAKSFVEAIQQQDPELLREVSEGCSPEKMEFFVREMNTIRTIRLKKQDGENITDHNDLAEHLSEEIKFQVASHGKGQKAKRVDYSLVFVRESNQSPWRIREILKDKQNEQEKEEENADNGLDQKP
jgi:hypothetical protein